MGSLIPKACLSGDRLFCSLTIWSLRNKGCESNSSGPRFSSGVCDGSVLFLNKFFENTLSDLSEVRGRIEFQVKGLILAQNERWRRGLGMQVERERFLRGPSKVAKG